MEQKANLERSKAYAEMEMSREKHQQELIKLSHETEARESKQNFSVVGGLVNLVKDVLKII